MTHDLPRCVETAGSHSWMTEPIAGISRSNEQQKYFTGKRDM
jgi:hypothetical protein